MTRFALALLVGASLLATSGCKKKAPEDDKAAENAKIPKAEKLQGFKNKKIRQMNEVVDSPEKGSPKHALLSLFTTWKKAKDAKWAGADDELFNEWRQLFQRGMQDNKTGSLKSILSKLVGQKKLEHYVSSESDGIVICKEQETVKGKTWRFYVRNDNPNTSNKPVKVHLVDGEWKLDDGFLL